MGINIKIGPLVNELKYKLNIKKTLESNFIIFDHPDIDIMVIPEKRKILVITNDTLNASSTTYDTQNQLFKFLFKKGVVMPDTIHAGSVYGSLQGLYPELKDGGDASATDFVLKAIAEWIDGERENWEYRDELKDQDVERLVDPDDTETTNLGKVPHRERRGANTPGMSTRTNGGW